MRTEAGAFSLAGVLLAAALLAACALAAAGPLSRGLQDAGSSGMASRAVYLAQEEAERLKDVPWAALSSSPRVEVPGFPGFFREVKVSDAGVLLKRVEVVVWYAAPGGEERVVLVFERAGVE
ncbi:MAG: hypothetical protein QME93_07895 [Bacillota bacterium]|nr:hypothetical protein [Bacillota bacterium]